MSISPLFVLAASLVCFLLFPFVSGAGPSSFSYPGKSTNWIIRAGGAFGQDEDNVSPGAPYLALKFYPFEVEIFSLDTVTWIFNGPEPHTVSFIDGFTSANPFDPRIKALQQQVGSYYYDNSTSKTVSSGLEANGANYTLFFNQTGDFPYLCAIHPGMFGKLHVRNWDQSLSKSPDDVFHQGSDELYADSAYATGDFIKQANLVGDVPYTSDSDGYRTWEVLSGVYAQPSDWNVTHIGPISAYDFFPGNGVFNITKGDRIKFINADQGIHTLAFQTNSTFIPFRNNPNYILDYIPDSQTNLMYTGGFVDYGLLVPFDPSHNNKTITFGKEGTYYVFCTLHSDMGMAAQINVFPENESENNETETQTSSSTGEAGGSGVGGGGSGVHPIGSSSGGGVHPIGSSSGTYLPGSSTGTISNNPTGSGTGSGNGNGGGGGTGGNNNSRNSAPAVAVYNPAMILATSIVLCVAAMMI
jgi:plastocyanin